MLLYTLMAALAASVSPHHAPAYQPALLDTKSEIEAGKHVRYWACDDSTCKPEQHFNPYSADKQYKCDRSKCMRMVSDCGSEGCHPMDVDIVGARN